MVLQLITALILAGLAWYVWDRRSARGGFYFSLLLVAAAWWAFFDAFDMSGFSLKANILITKLAYAGIVSVAPLWLLFALAYCQKDRWLTGNRVLLVWIVPVVTYALALTNEWHGLMWPIIAPLTSSPDSIVNYSHGIGDWVLMSYSYVLVLLGMALLVSKSLRSSHKNQGRTVGLIAGAIMPMAGNFIYFAGLTGLAGVDFTPFAMCVTGVLYSYLIFGQQLFNIMPVASETLIASMADGVLVLDRQNRILSVNPAASRLVGGGSEVVTGEPMQDAPLLWPELEKHVVDRQEVSFEIRLPDGTGSRWLEVRNTPLVNRFGAHVGRLIIIRDVSERKQAEEELSTAKYQSELYLDLMGHDISNMHQVALGYLELARDMPGEERKAAFLDKSVEVLLRSTKLIANVRKLQKLRDGGFEAREVDACRVLAEVQSEYGTMPGKTVRLNLSGHEKCTVGANELLHDVFANLVNNAVKHTGNGKEIVVTLDIVEEGGVRFCRVTIDDDGPGIPDDSKERVFNRLHNDSARGMGLGLYIVKSLVDSYNGRVWVENRVKDDHTKGARFVVMLPAIDEQLRSCRA